MIYIAQVILLLNRKNVVLHEKKAYCFSKTCLLGACKQHYWTRKRIYYVKSLPSIDRTKIQSEHGWNFFLTSCEINGSKVNIAFSVSVDIKKFCEITYTYITLILTFKNLRFEDQRPCTTSHNYQAIFLIRD